MDSLYGLWTACGQRPPLKGRGSSEINLEEKALTLTVTAATLMTIHTLNIWHRKPDRTPSKYKLYFDDVLRHTYVPPTHSGSGSAITLSEWTISW